MASGLRAMGVIVEERADGAIINGSLLQGGRINSQGDHRIAMAFAMAALVAQGDIEILDCANVATSFPSFPALAHQAGLLLEVVSA